jgi:hypothetical protein
MIAGNWYLLENPELYCEQFNPAKTQSCFQMLSKREGPSSQTNFKYIHDLKVHRGQVHVKN